MRPAYDLLLEWVSEKGEGTWQQFRNAWDWLSSRGARIRDEDPAEKGWIAAANLAALGHMEITWEGNGKWAAAPPVLTMLSDSGGRALLTGARTRALYWPASGDRPPQGKLAKGAEELDLWVDELAGWSSASPTSVVVACNEPSDAERLARLCGIAYTYSVSDELSALLPPLGAYAKLWQPGRLPQGFQAERYDASSLDWHEIQDDEPTEPGLYRSRTYKDHVHVLVQPTGASFRVTREHAVYEVLRWEDRTVLDYDPARRELWVPVGARLPLLHERAAVLSTGQLGEFRRRDGMPGRLYFNVQPEIASRIAASLSQQIVTSD